MVLPSGILLYLVGTYSLWRVIRHADPCREAIQFSNFSNFTVKFSKFHENTRGRRAPCRFQRMQMLLERHSPP